MKQNKIPDTLTYPHAKTAQMLFDALQTSTHGLTSKEAKVRLEIYGPNMLDEAKQNLFLLFLSQFQSPLVYVLVIAAVLSFVLGNLHEGVIIFTIVVVNAAIGFWQEIKALTSIEALKKLTENRTKVKRDNAVIALSSYELVPGDVAVLSEGDIIPADIRLFQTYSVFIDESILTGESVPTQKDANPVLAENSLPYELSNMALSGTTMTKGKAEGVVIFTGESSYLASIAEKVKEKSPQSPLTKALGIFGKKLISMLSVLIALTAVLALWRGREIVEVIYLVIAELVSAVPEGLPIAVTLVLTIGAMALSLKKVYIKHLPSAQTLGSATVIATDKTGTITQGKLEVKEVFLLHETLSKTISALANESTQGKGDPMDTALEDWVGETYEETRLKYPRITIYPFDVKYRLMASSNMVENEQIISVKGAFESLMQLATNKEDFEKLQSAHDKMANDGMRVIALGSGQYGGDEIEEWKIEITGLVGFLDPPKAGVAEAVQIAQNAGIKVIMITGDNLLTALAVAKSVHIYKEGDMALEGNVLSQMDDKMLESLLPRITVLARVLPEHKYRIVKILQKMGETVAVTGDGVNDVPAIKAADLGISMGDGSDAAKSTAKMVLADNNLSVIVDAIRQGRTIAGNIRKTIYFLVSTGLDEVILITSAILMSLPLPLYPVQILWINLVSDSALDKTFPFMKEEENVMNRPPAKIHEQIIGLTQFLRIIYTALVVSMGALFLYVWMLEHQGKETAVSTLFSAFVFATWMNGLQSIKEYEPFFKNIKKSLRINPYIFYGIFIGIVLHISAIYLFPEVFHTLPLDGTSMMMIGVLSVWVFGMIELRKWTEYLWSRRQPT